MLLFTNKGLMNETALTTLGVNVKLNDSPIGQFGTGLKYAIAVVLRLGGEIAVWRGKKLLQFGTREETVRGQTVRVVTMNGRKLGYTDHLGSGWEPWMVFRELWSNARDEGGSVSRIASISEFEPRANHTTVVVNCPAVEKAYEERHQIILMSEPMLVLPGVEVHVGNSEHIFYKGIRVHKLPKKSYFTYNLTEHHSLTEDRTLLYPWGLESTVASGFVQSTNMQFLHTVLSDDVKDRWEEKFSYDSLRHLKPTVQFMEAAQQLDQAKKLSARATGLFKHYQDTLPGYSYPYMVTPSEVDEKTIAEALALLTGKTGITLSRASVTFKSQLTLGRVQVSKSTGVVVQYDLVKKGAAELAAALLEGSATLAGGSTVAQLCRLLISGKFATEEERAVRVPGNSYEVVF